MEVKNLNLKDYVVIATCFVVFLMIVKGAMDSASQSIEDSIRMHDQTGKWQSNDPCPACGHSPIWKETIQLDIGSSGYRWSCPACGSAGENIF